LFLFFVAFLFSTNNLISAKLLAKKRILRWKITAITFQVIMASHYQIKVIKAFCKGCELCVSICPRHAIFISKNVTKSGFHFPESNNNPCSGCRQCAIICPEAAIEIFMVSDGKKDKDK